MGFKFRKSIKVAPGVKLNLGKKSAGISFGGKKGGISFNSKSGARLRTSIPGTGISYSTKLGGGSSRKNSRSSSSSSTKTVQVEVDATTYLMLTILLGFIGAHRFYRKQYKLGLLYLFTGGLAGIGWIVDICIAVSLYNKNKKTNEE